MAFKKTFSPTFCTTVVVNVPNDAGGFDKNDFFATFKRPTTAQEKALRNEAGLTNEDLVRRQLVGWKMVDENADDVPFNPNTLDAALQVAPTPLATAVAFWECVNGARAKN